MADEPKPKSAPYREPAPVLTLIPGPPPLAPFNAWNTAKFLITLPAKGESTTSDRVSNVHCPKCAFNTLSVVPKLCRGRVIGMCKKVICSERREHFHVRCTSCDQAYLMATHEGTKEDQKT